MPSGPPPPRPVPSWHRRLQEADRQAEAGSPPSRASAALWRRLRKAARQRDRDGGMCLPPPFAAALGTTVAEYPLPRAPADIPATSPASPGDVLHHLRQLGYLEQASPAAPLLPRRARHLRARHLRLPRGRHRFGAFARVQRRLLALLAQAHRAMLADLRVATLAVSTTAVPLMATFARLLSCTGEEGATMAARMLDAPGHAVAGWLGIWSRALSMRPLLLRQRQRIRAIGARVADAAASLS